MPEKYIFAQVFCNLHQNATEEQPLQSRQAAMEIQRQEYLRLY